jgi:PadR family transcriptional regulator PadR
MNPQANLIFPREPLNFLIVRVVALCPNHSYAIAQRIQQMSRKPFQVQQGSLYPVLHRLEYKKLFKANRKTSETGREAKFYELTATGRISRLKPRTGAAQPISSASS